MDEQILLRCKCGEYKWLEVAKFVWSKKETEYIVSLIDEPRTLFERIKSAIEILFKGSSIVNDIILTRKDLQKIGKIAK